MATSRVEPAFAVLRALTWTPWLIYAGLVTWRAVSTLLFLGWVPEGFMSMMLSDVLLVTVLPFFDTPIVATVLGLALLAGVSIVWQVCHRKYEGFSAMLTALVVWWCGSWMLWLQSGALVFTFSEWPTPAWPVFAVLGVSSLLLLPFLVNRPNGLKWLLALCLVVWSFAVLVIPWDALFENSRRRFLADLYSIEPGMTLEQVEGVMEGYMKGTGWPAAPEGLEGATTLTLPGSGETYETRDTDDGMEIVDSVTYRHSNAGAYNSDWGIVTFDEQGRVTKVTFSPD